MSFNGELSSDGVSRYFSGTMVRRSTVLAGFFSRPLRSCCAGVSWTMPCFHSLHLAGLLQRGVVLVVGCREVRWFIFRSQVQFAPLVAVRRCLYRPLSHSLHLPIRSGCCVATGRPAARHLSPGRCPRSPPIGRRSGAASGPSGRCAAAPCPRILALSASFHGPAHASCDPLRALR